MRDGRHTATLMNLNIFLSCIPLTVQLLIFFILLKQGRSKNRRAQNTTKDKIMTIYIFLITTFFLINGTLLFVYITYVHMAKMSFCYYN